MTAARHLLIRASDGRIMVIDERTGAAAGALAPVRRSASLSGFIVPSANGSERAFVWSRFAVWFALGAVAGAWACKAGGW